MSAGERVPFARGLQIAREVIALLDGTYTRITVAGSLRRGKPDVGDVELVVAPAFQGGVNLLDYRCDKLLMDGTFKKRLNKRSAPIAWSKREKAATFGGVALDMFVVLPDRQWGPTMLLRTGPGEANEALVTRWGFVSRNGRRGVLPGPLQWMDGAIWKDGQKLDTPEEADVFAACELPFVPPDRRSAAEYLRQTQWRADGRDFRGSEVFPSWFRGGRHMGIPRDALHVGGKPYWLPVGTLVEQRQAVESLVVEASTVQESLFV